MLNEAYATVRCCRSYAQIGTLENNQRKVKLFSPESPLEYGGMNIPGPVPRTKEGNQLFVVMKDRYTKLTETTPTANTNATTVARSLPEHWVETFGMPSKLLTDNGPQSASEIFVVVCSTFVVNNITTTEYHYKPTARQKISTQL